MKRLDPANVPWLTAPEAQAVIRALNAVQAGSARFVGGCLRNTLRGAPVDDVDIATQLEPDAVTAALEVAGIRAIPTGIKHGTVTAVHNSKAFEITTLRRDVETDGRRAVVAFTQDWAVDAARRDFRLNAIYADAEGNLFEPIAGSIEDAVTGRVIFVGDADQRLREDYLRILRFFRFNAWYGAGMDEAGLAACGRHASGLERIAVERVWKELSKMLAAPDPASAVLAMSDSGVLAEILPHAAAAGIAGLVAVEAAAGLPPEPLRRLMTLVPRRQRDVQQVASELKLSNADRARLLAWADAGLMPVLEAPDAGIRAAIYRHGARAVSDRAAVEAAEGGRVAELRRVLALTDTWRAPVFPVGGKDALSLGLEGPDVGAALSDVEGRWVDGDFEANRETLLKWLAAAD